MDVQDELNTKLGRKMFFHQNLKKNCQIAVLLWNKDFLAHAVTT
jgi:hypothetical protein